MFYLFRKFAWTQFSIRHCCDIFFQIKPFASNSPLFLVTSFRLNIFAINLIKDYFKKMITTSILYLLYFICILHVYCIWFKSFVRFHHTHGLNAGRSASDSRQSIFDLFIYLVSLVWCFWMFDCCYKNDKKHIWCLVWYGIDQSIVKCGVVYWKTHI